MSRFGHATALCVAGALTMSGATELKAAPVLTNTAAVKAAAPSSMVDVRWGWRGGGWGWRGGWGGRGWWWPGAIAGGIALGAAVAAAPYYYGCGYPYGYGCGYPYAYSGYAHYGSPYWSSAYTGYADRAYWGGYPGYWGVRRPYWGGY
jgi:hypothetical protein